MDDIRKRLEQILEPELVKEIMASGRHMRFKEGDIILEYGKRIRFMPLILKGTVKVMRKEEEGREILLYYLTSNETCAMAYVCCMEDKISEVQVIAEEDVELLAIPNEKLDEWLIRFPRWKSFIFNSFTSRFNEMLKSLESVAFHKLDERLITYLRNKSKISGKTVLQLSHSHIAEEMGTSRVVISRLLKQLENEKKLILYRNEIKLLQNFFE
jgi:CRP/FNR family transcriptional regulator, anaerobic regulatory protein